MRRTGLARAFSAVVLAALVTACGSSTPTTSTSTRSAPAAHGLSVDPQRGSPDSTVTFSFTPRRSAGAHGKVSVSYVVSILGPRRAGCVGTHTAAAPGAVVGRSSHVALSPAQLGAKWCAGAYTARAQAFERPVCKPGQECPMYIRLIGTVGTAAFRITS